MSIEVKDNSLTFGLDGDVRLDELATAMTQFSRIAQGLAAEIDASLSKTWTISSLRDGSAFATASIEGIAPEGFSRISDRYLQLADELNAGRIVSFPESVGQPARKLLRLVSSRIPDLVFETARETRFVSGISANAQRPRALSAYGVLQGRIQTLSSRNALRFALYEPVFDRAVNCYVTESQQEILRGLWDKWAAVEGTISRNSVNGVPLAIRDIERIVVVQMSEPGSFRRARGVVPSTGESPEDTIRRYRDV